MRIKFKKILVRVGIVFLVIIAVGLVTRTIFNYTTGKKLERTLEKMKDAGEKLAIKEFEPDCRDEDNAALSWKGVEEILQIDREQRELLSKTLKEIFYKEPLTNSTRRKIEIMAEKNQRALLLMQDWAVMRCEDGFTLNWYGPGIVRVPIRSGGIQSEEAGTML